jgi:hypothetical protein
MRGIKEPYIIISTSKALYIYDPVKGEKLVSIASSVPRAEQLCHDILDLLNNAIL